jgi:hypothetical protein
MYVLHDSKMKLVAVEPLKRKLKMIMHVKIISVTSACKNTTKMVIKNVK